MKKHTLFILLTISIFVIYHVCFDLTTLVPTNINWLMAIRHDWGTHYLGWAFFKNEPWHFPLGRITDYNYPVGTNVGYTDSIPLLAIFFKLFARWLPEDFQYYGLWLLVCHWLAAYFTVLICKQFKLNSIITFVAALFVATNPVLIYRAMHPALCAHWLLIASIYLYILNPITVPPRKILFYQLLLLLLAALINPYLCWMVLGFTFFTSLKLCFFDKVIKKWYFVAYQALSLALLLLLWYVIGMIEFSPKEDLGVGGSYGLYALNLNSLFNSFGYSRFFPALKQVSAHQYEGYMYLGLGMFLLLFVLLIYSAYFFFKQRNGAAYIATKTPTTTIRLTPLVILTVLYSILAITLVFTYNDKVLFRIPAPKAFMQLVEIFRANSRFFWIPYYLIFIFTIIAIARSKMKPFLASILITGAFLIQLYDINSLLVSRRDTSCCTYKPPMNEKVWIKLMSQFDEILFLPAFTAPPIRSMVYQDFSYLALKAGKPVNLAYVARADSRAMQAYSDSLSTVVESANLSPGALYIVDGSNLDRFSFALQSNKARLNTLDGCYYIFSASIKNDSLDAQARLWNKVDQMKLDSAWRAFGLRREFAESEKIPTINNNVIRCNPETVRLSENAVSIKGWAFVDTTQDNKQDSIFVTLTSGEKSYRAKARLVDRADMATFKRTYLNNAGFEFLAFTDSVQKGVYQLGLAIKNVNGIFIYQPINKEIKVKFPAYAIPFKTDRLATTVQINNDLQINEKDSVLSLSGWAAIANQDADDCTIFIVLKSDENIYLFATEPSPRPDVTASFKNKFSLDNSGYTVNILKSKIEKGKYKIGFLIKDVKKNVEKSMLTEKEVKLNIPEYDLVEKTTQLAATGNINYDLVVNEKDGEFSASGWAAIVNQDAENCTIFLVLKSNQASYICSTQSSLRPDVTSSFNNKYKLDNSGYTTKILKTSLDKGIYQVGILIRDKKRNTEKIIYTDKQIKAH